MRKNLIKDLCIIVVSYKSNKKTKNLIKKINRKISIIIVENSMDINFKKQIEKKYKNVSVIIPKSNDGFAASLNIAVKKTKKKYIMYFDSDITIKNSQITKLLSKGKEINKFGAITPKIYKQDYKSLILDKPKIKGLSQVWFNTGCVILMKKKYLKRLNYFDDNIFLYYEESDFYKRCIDSNLPVLMYDKVTIKHEGSASIDSKYDHEYRKIRNWHYCWSKFYYFNKHHGYLFGLSKTFPNFVRSAKKIIFSLINFKFNEASHYYSEIEGLICSYLKIKAFYRIKKN